MRILVATVTAGGGHLQAAAAVEEAWRDLRPSDTVEKLDVLDFSPGLYKRLYAGGYVTLAEHAPELYGLLFKKTDNTELTQKLTRLRRTISRALSRPFVDHLQRSQPEVVVCTHYLPLEILGGLKAKGASSSPFTVCVITDFEAHALWMEGCVDLYCVAAEQTKASLAARGAGAEQITVTGIPIAAKYRQEVEASAVRRHYGLRDDLPVLLVLAGGFGMGPVAEILAQVNQLSQPAQVIAVAGRNEELRRELASQEHRLPTRVLGFVTNLHELMTVADLVVTKPGGLTTSEALAVGRPLFIVNPVPGQETANSDFLLEHGAAVKVNRLADVPVRIDALLGSDRLSELSRAAKGLGRPNAAPEICREILARVAQPGSGVLGITGH